MMSTLNHTDSRTDGELVAASKLGDHAALEALVERYQALVLRFGLSMCRDEDAGRDVSQETLLAMVRFLPTFRSDALLSTWLYAIARHACARRHRRAHLSISSLDALSPRDYDALVADRDFPDAATAAAEARGVVREAIRALSPEHRTVLILRDVRGASADEAARTLQISVPALKSRLHRARLAFRDAVAVLLRPPVERATSGGHIASRPAATAANSPHDPPAGADREISGAVVRTETRRDRHALPSVQHSQQAQSE